MNQGVRKKSAPFSRRSHPPATCPQTPRVADGAPARRRRGSRAAPIATRSPAEFATTSARRSSSSFGMSILTGQTSAQAPQRLEAKGSQGSLSDAVELRRDDGADRARIHPGIAVPADLAVDRAVIQASAAANAVQRLPLLGMLEQLGAAVVEQHDVELVGPVDLVARAAGRRGTTCRRSAPGRSRCGRAASGRRPGPARGGSTSRCRRRRCGSWARWSSGGRCLRSRPARRRPNRRPGNSRR